MADDSWWLPNIVQEVAANAPEPPSRYVILAEDRVAADHQLAGAAMPEPVPTIDLRRLLASDGDGAAEEEAAKLRSALQTWGYFLVTNHGIEGSLMDAVIAASREFFHQPLEQKQEYSNLIEGKRWQLEGYGNDPVKTQDQILDWCDRLHLRVEPEDERNLALWPKNPESFRDLLHEYTLKCKVVKDGILRAMANLLELDEDYIVKLGWRQGFHVLRDGTWYNIPPVRDHALLINMGVLMEIMTNGIFKGPVHRVVTNSEKERISLAMFFATDLDKDIEPLPGLIDEKHPARYKKIKFNDLVSAHYEYFSKKEIVIESLKIY
ncbi:hypothetical protein ACP4OV_016920 [Aristida adscensionis]